MKFMENAMEASDLIKFAFRTMTSQNVKMGIKGGGG